MRVKEILFGEISAEEKLEKIKKLPNEVLLSATDIAKVLLEIIQQCGKDGEFRIKNDRRVGNNWNSLVEGIRLYKNYLYVDVYIQSDSTDTNTSALYHDMLTGGGSSYVESRLGTVKYREDDKAEVVRGFLLEYIYYKYIEADERKAAEMIRSLLDYKIINPICDHYFEEYGLFRLPFSYATTKPQYKTYCKCKKAIEEYIKEHYSELYGKSKEELTTIYNQVWKKTERSV